MRAVSSGTGGTGCGRRSDMDDLQTRDPSNAAALHKAADFANRWAARRRAPSWRGNGARLPCRTDVSPGLDRAVDPISAAVSERLIACMGLGRGSDLATEIGA